MKIVAWEEAKLNREVKMWGWGTTVLFCVFELVRKQLYFNVQCKIINFLAKNSRRKALKQCLIKRDGESYFDFCGAKLPYIAKERDKILNSVFEHIFFISYCYNDNYDKKIVERLDEYMGEGPYGYVDGAFDVTVHEGDVVIDAGAWIGDFSAYAASKGATAYAFEPTKETYDWLQKTVELNEKGRIIPVQKGLGDKVETMTISANAENSGANSLIKVYEGEKAGGTERVEITTIDSFVKEQNLQRVDFIKSDIEGFERNLLMGARETLKKFAPKLALCTYHLPDDPQVMYHLIKEANPDYTVVFLSHKLFAAVVK